MEELKEKGAFSNPYVMQMDKFADSLVHLSRTFFTLEGYKGTFSREELETMFSRVTEQVCENCENREECLGEKKIQTYQRMYDILCAVEKYGAEINIELKRKLQKQCVMAPRFLRETLEAFENAKQQLIWNNRMVQNREGYAGQLQSFAKMIQYTTRELEASIFEDRHLEKKLKNHLKKQNIKMMSAVFYITQQGKYEVHLSVKAPKGQCIATKELAHEVGKCLGRPMIPGQNERPILGNEYASIACVEGAKYQTIQGVARIGKEGESISGDTFLMTDLPGGKKGIALSDGMGSGEEAFRDSTMVVEMLEELLEAGFPVNTAIQMMNTALVIGREEVRFSTVDVSLFDLYDGTCEIVKAGASTTFIKRKDKVEMIRSTSLPIGVLADIETDQEKLELESGDMVIMVTDGVLDMLTVGEQDTIMCTLIEQSSLVNPKEFANYLLGQALEWGQSLPGDDMTIIVTGIWKL